ncbi:Glycosyltransferase involved in cell wall bisynthesis [Cohnella sp. OV330]|uniref:glycosyltransferase family 2 protein n=1 Tax=Cohnella sp. OV330 TaxID=1855288 RepID=UPI0008F2D7E8|nr:glycosyltransferase family 2 protein [Cohnella sp. OV330]SFB47472.1 Glycosyltransferase involved in cell wall bisynthesis [Cohnella sp. OV330]
MKTLIIVPAFNEQGNIEMLIKRLQAFDVDILIVNDSSTDNTSRLSHELGVKVIDLPCNLGIGGAVQTGYKYAYKYEYDCAIQIDGDGQHDPTYIESLIQPISNSKADLVIGSRYINMEGFQSTFMRRVGIKYFSVLIRLLTKRVITDPTSGFRACNKVVIKHFAENYPVDYPEPESIVNLLRNGLTVVELPVIMHSRQHGNSSIHSFKSVYYMIKVSIAILIDSLRRKKSEGVLNG